MRDDLFINFGQKVPATGFPLAHIHVPEALLPPIMGIAEGYQYNIPGLVLRYDGVSGTVNIFGASLGMSVTGVLSYNLVQNGSFYTLNNWSATGFTHSNTLGRTGENSSFLSNSTDVPAFGQNPDYAPYCAVIPWTFTGQATLVSNNIAVSGSPASTVYQLTFWLATDPVIDGKRYQVSGTPVHTMDIASTVLQVAVLGYDASNALTETAFIDTIDSTYGAYLSQRTTRYLKYRTGLFRKSSASTAYFKIRFICNNGGGLYFDDVVLTSLLYSTDVPLNNGSATIPATGSTLYNEETELRNINSTFVECPSSIDYFDVVLYSNNLITNGTFAGNCAEWSFINASIDNDVTHSFIDNSSYSILLRSSGDDAQVYQTVPINGMLEYEAAVYWRKFDSGSVTMKLRAETFDVSGQTVQVYAVTAISTGNADSDWRRLSLNFCPASTGVTSVKITVGNLINPSITLVADDVQLRQARGSKSFGTSNYWPYSYGPAGLRNFGWRVEIAIPVVGERYDQTWKKESVIRFDPSYYNMYFGRWESPSGMANTGFYRHYIAPLKKLIKKTNTLNDHVRFWNTKEDMQSLPFLVQPGKLYRIHVPLAYPLHTFAGNIISQDVNNVSDLFCKPLTLTYTPGNMFGYTPEDAASGQALFGWEITNSRFEGVSVRTTNTGYIRADIAFYNSSGQLLSTVTPLIIGPSGGISDSTNYVSVDGLKPVISKENPNWKYTCSIASRDFLVPSTAVSGIATITFCGTACGIKAFYLYNVSPRTSSVTGYLEIEKAFNEDVSRLSFLTDQLRLDGIYVDVNDAWHPAIKDGLFERDYTVRSSDTFLIEQGWEEDDKLRLIYTVPEFCLEPAYDPLTHQEEVVLADAEPLDDHTVYLHNKNIVKILRLEKNDEVLIPVPIAINDLPALYPEIHSVDAAAGTLTFAGQVSALDEIKVSYTFERTRYVYRGYYDGGKWYDLDLNPACGHRLHVGADNCGQPTSVLLNSGVTIYAIPTAAYTADGDQTGHYTYRSVFSLPVEKRPSYFIRHRIGLNVDSQIMSEHPYAVILGKIVVPNPCSLPDVNIIDLRPRGGGLPEDWSNPPLFTEEYRTLIPCGASGLIYTGIELAVGEKLEITALSNIPAATGGIIPPTNILYGLITQGTTGFLIGDHYLTTVSTSGKLCFMVTSIPVTGFIYARTLVTRKTQKSSRWDTESSWDGEPVMLNGVVIIEVDKRVLTGEDGFRKVTAEEVEAAAKTHVAAGVLPIIRYV